jgi:PAS domain S-box-containing protein
MGGDTPGEKPTLDVPEAPEELLHRGASPGRSGVKPRTIRRILLLILLAALVPGMLVQALLHLQRFHTEQAREIQTHADVARAVAVAFKAAIEDVAQEAHTIGQAILRFAPQDHAAGSRFLSAALQRYPAAAELAWLSPDGRVVAASGSGAVGEDRHAEAYFMALGGKRPWALGPVQPDRQSGAATFTVAHVLDGEDGRRPEVLTVTIDAERFADSRLKIHRTPDAGFILFDNKGFAAFRRPYFPFPQWQQRDFSKEEFVSVALAGQEASGKLDLPVTGKRWFTARTPVPELGWVAGAGREYDSVMAPLWRDLSLGVGLSVLCFLISSGIALHYGRKILTDLQGLRDLVTAWGEPPTAATPSAAGNIAEVRNITSAFETVTRRHGEAEQALRESEARFRSLAESNIIGVVVADSVTGQVFDANDEYLRIIGCSREELRAGAVNWRSSTPPDELAREDALFHHRQRDGWVETFDKTYLRKDGTRASVIVGGSFLPHDPQKVIAFVLDITARQQAEEAVIEARAEAELRALEFQTLLDIAPVAIWVALDPLCLQINGNRFADEMIMQVPRKANISASAPPGGAAVTYGVFRAGVKLEPEELPAQVAAATGQPVANEVLELRFSDGRTVNLLEGAAPLFDAAGHVRGAIATAMDVTPIIRAEEALRQANQRLEQRVLERTAELKERAEQLGRLSSQLTMAEQRERKRLAQILHDGLQQYLVAAKLQVGGFIEQAEDSGLKQAAADIENLLGEAIGVSRSMAAELSPRLLYESGLTAGLEWLSRWMSDKHGLKVELAIRTDAPVLTEDVKLFLFESVRELLLNVVKHGNTRFAKVSVAPEDGRSLQIIVSDNGAGFDPASASIEDGGFGLFSIRERIRLIGGRLEVDSSPGTGARFTLTVPLEIRNLLEPMHSSPHIRVNGTVAAALPRPDGKTRILLTDDHSVMREGLARLLGQEPDFEVVGQASDGLEAIEKAGELQPDVILMDISMPRMNGIDAARIIHERHPSIRIIGLSIYSEEERAREMLDAGASYYMTKSGPSADLKAAIRACRDEKFRAGNVNARPPTLGS